MEVGLARKSLVSQLVSASPERHHYVDVRAAEVEVVAVPEGHYRPAEGGAEVGETLEQLSPELRGHTGLLQHLSHHSLGQVLARVNIPETYLTMSD